MVKINVQPDCGNSPRKLFLKQLYVAFAYGDTGFLTENISESIEWEITGKLKVTGKKVFLDTLFSLEYWKVKELVIETIITHSADASVSGVLTTNDNSKYDFCDICKFKTAGGTSIKSIKSFLIKLS